MNATAITFKRLFTIIQLSYTHLGLRRATMRTVFLALYLTFTHLTLLLDYLFFPFFLCKKIKAPIFIVGMPRSGTTLIHKTFVNHNSFVRFDAWDIFFPAITAKFLLYPLKQCLKTFNLGSIMPKEAGHEVHLFKPEEEEFLFLHLLNTQIIFPVFLLGKDHPLAEELIFSEASRLDVWATTWLKRIFQRHLLWSKDTQIIAQMHMSVMRLPSLRQSFPDAKFIVSIRKSKEAIPSHLTLTKNVLLSKNPNITESLQTHILDTRVYYDTLIYHQMKRHLIEGQLSATNHVLVNYEDLVGNLEATIRHIINTLQINVDELFWNDLSDASNKQHSYKRAHGVSNFCDLKGTALLEDPDFIAIEQELLTLASAWRL